MTDTITRLMHANLIEVFNERDTERRRAAISRTYAPDVRWTEDDGATVGHADLDARAVDLQQKIGDLQFVAAGPVYQTVGLGYLAWHLVSPGSDTPQVAGFDVAIVRNDVIVELYTVITQAGG
jgi:hypothetical protein